MFVARIEGRTIREALIVLLEIGLRTLGPCTNGHGVVLVRVAGRREFIKMGALLVLADHEQTNTVWAASVFLGVDLRL